jgi:hypothetical protein
MVNRGWFMSSGRAGLLRCCAEQCHCWTDRDSFRFFGRLPRPPLRSLTRGDQVRPNSEVTALIPMNMDEQRLIRMGICLEVRVRRIEYALDDEIEYRLSI